MGAAAVFGLDLDGGAIANASDLKNISSLGGVEIGHSGVSGPDLGVVLVGSHVQHSQVA